MKRVLLILLLSIGVIEGVIACTVSANVGDLSATSAESGSDAPANDGGADAFPPSDAEAEDAADGSDAPLLEAGCGVTLAQEASFVDVQVQMTGPPNFVGGTIVPGIYVLTAMNVYFAGTTGTVRVRETMRVRGTSPAGAFDRLTEAQNPSGSFMGYPLHGETSTWRAPNGPIFFQTPECPTKSFEGTGNFTAQGTTLSVFDGQRSVERVYRRLR